MKVLFTGGGSAGHVTPNLALMEAAQTRGWQVAYAGSAAGIESSLVASISSVPFHAVQSGKLRRYFSWQNFTDPFRLFIGIVQSLALCLREKPDCVFSKGGFVSVPVVLAAWLCRIPVVSHESDLTPGLANRLAFPFCRTICLGFAETALAESSRRKARHTGTPLRSSLVGGDATRGLELLGFDGGKPVLLVVGGSLGAAVINQQIARVLPRLLETFDVVHVVGEGRLDDVADVADVKGYVPVPFLAEGYGDVLAAADLVVSRAGANAIYELLALRKPHLLIPLSRRASRGDQIENARLFQAQGMSQVMEEDELGVVGGRSGDSDVDVDVDDGRDGDDAFVNVLLQTWQGREAFVRSIQAFEVKDSVGEILSVIETAAG